jgi:hypothetical protein
MKFAIKYGLGGGFGGCERNEPKIIDVSSEKEAGRWAYEMAVQEYQSYEGLHGLRTYDEIMEQDELSEDEAEQAYIEEMDSWLDYYVEEVKE